MQDYSIFDWKRLLLGVAPWSFLIEVLVRVLCVYSVLVLVVRLFGKRLSGHVGNLELGVVIALGAIVSVPFQDPTRGVVPGVLLLGALLALQRGVSALGVRYPRVEEFTQNRVSMLVADGRLELDALRGASISVDQLLAVLRSQGVRHLGEVKRVYLEAYGLFSVYRAKHPRDGLPLVPHWDPRGIDSLSRARESQACGHCGEVRYTPGRNDEPCQRCGRRDWVVAAQGDA